MSDFFSFLKIYFFFESWDFFFLSALGYRGDEMIKKSFFVSCVLI